MSSSRCAARSCWTHRGSLATSWRHRCWLATRRSVLQAWRRLTTEFFLPIELATTFRSCSHIPVDRRRASAKSRYRHGHRGRYSDGTFRKWNSFWADSAGSQLERRVLRWRDLLKISNASLIYLKSMLLLFCNNQLTFGLLAELLHNLKRTFTTSYLPSKTVSAGPEIKASHSKKFSSEIGPAMMPSGGFRVSSIMENIEWKFYEKSPQFFWWRYQQKSGAILATHACIPPWVSLAPVLPLLN